MVGVALCDGEDCSAWRSNRRRRCRKGFSEDDVGSRDERESGFLQDTKRKEKNKLKWVQTETECE